MDRKYTYVELQSFLLQECSEEESKGIRAFLSTPEGKAFLEEYMSSLWLESESAEMDKQLEDRGYQLLLTKKRVLGGTTYKFSRFLKYAVAAVAIVVLGWGLKIVLIPTLNLDQRQNNLAHTDMRSFKTGMGQRAQLSLEDGTKVTLGPMSEISYPRHFAKNERKIELTGQAYFDVRQDAERPFTIASNNYITTVLGTSFLVDSYQDDKYRLYVTSGRVQVEHESPDGSRTLLGILDRGTEIKITDHIPKIQEFDPDDITSWLGKELVFNDEPLKEIVKEINRNYALQIQIQDTVLAKLPITIKVAHGSDVVNLLKQAGEHIGFQIEKKENYYIIH